MKVVSINTESTTTVLSQLQDDIETAIQRAVDASPNLSAITILGVLCMVEHNFVARFPDKGE